MSSEFVDWIYVQPILLCSCKVTCTLEFATYWYSYLSISFQNLSIHLCSHPYIYLNSIFLFTNLLMTIIDRQTDKIALNSCSLVKWIFTKSLIQLSWIGPEKIAFFPNGSDVETDVPTTIWNFWTDSLLKIWMFLWIERITILILL